MTAQPALAATDNIEVTIEAGQSLSGPINLKGRIPTIFHMPASFSGTALTFQAAEASEGTYRDFYVSGAEYSVTVGAGQAVGIDSLALIGLRFIRVRSGTSGTPTVEGSERTIQMGATIPSISQ